MKQSVILKNVYVLDKATAAGPLEKKGPLGQYFDVYYNSQRMDEKTYEDGGKRMLIDSINFLIEKTKTEKKIDLMCGGDLSNQIACSNYISSRYPYPFIGVYGACSTSVLSMILGSTYIDSNIYKNVLCFVSSHNCTAERQFRYPTEYGIQRKNTSTWTTTGYGAVILTNKKKKIKVTSFTIGKTIDWGYSDVNDTGGIMAPAALDTLKVHLSDLKRDVSYYDLILTGDLSSFGKKIFIDLAKKEGIDLTQNYDDCGTLLYDLDNQKVDLGGSGCACSALVTYGYIFELLKKKKLHRVLLIATGSLHSPVYVQQKNSIPGIAHAISFEVE